MDNKRLFPEMVSLLRYQMAHRKNAADNKNVYLI